MILRLENKDKKYISEYLDKKKILYKCYQYPFTKNRYGDSKKSMTYIYRDEFIPLMNINSRLAIKMKKKDKFRIIERSFHTMLNTFGMAWEEEAITTNWLTQGRINTFKHYEGDHGIISLLCLFIIWNTKINDRLIRLLI